MRLVYDPRDWAYARTSRSRHIEWLINSGAEPLSRHAADDEQFLFAGDRSIDDYRRLVSRFSLIRDSVEARQPLLQLDTVLEAIAEFDIPTPRTWKLLLDVPLPTDLRFPLFLRTPRTSWKLGGGRVSRVRTVRQLRDESELLRRAFGWDSPILARQWLDLAMAGEGVYGPVPQEIRVWVVAGVPVAWSFHHAGLINMPAGFPPAASDLKRLFEMAKLIAAAFHSHFIVADFSRETSGGWIFIEAGPGSCAGTRHEGVYRHVIAALKGVTFLPFDDEIGGAFS